MQRSKKEIQSCKHNSSLIIALTEASNRTEAEAKGPGNTEEVQPVHMEAIGRMQMHNNIALMRFTRKRPT